MQKNQQQTLFSKRGLDMNSVSIVGRMVRNAETKYTSGEKPLAITSFTVAVDRVGGKEKAADFINCKAFGKTAEFVEKYFPKGKSIGLVGRIQTGSYKDKDDRTVYTTEVIAEKVEFVGSKNDGESTNTSVEPSKDDIPAMIPEGFTKLEDDDIPF